MKGPPGVLLPGVVGPAGCVPDKGRSTAVLNPPLIGLTFERRVISETATTIGGKRVRLTVRHFGGRIDATFFLIRDRLPRLLRALVLRDAAGRVVAVSASGEPRAHARSLRDADGSLT